MGVLGLLALAGSASAPALAEDSGWYIGANGGWTYARIDDRRINNELIGEGFTTVSIADDDRDRGYKLFAGYQFNRNFAIEGTYFDLGEFGYKATTLPAGTVSGRMDTHGYSLDLVGLYNFTDRLAIVGRFGGNSAQSDLRFTDSGLVHVLHPARSEMELNNKYGIGLQYALTPSLDLRFEAERYQVNDAIGSTGDIDLASLGLLFRFGQNKPAPKPAQAAYVAPVKIVQPVVVTVPVAKTEEYCTILDLEFTINDSGIQLAGMEKLRVLGTFLNKYPKTTAVIQGHSDNVGRPQDNQKLSLARAQSVVDLIVDRFNVDRSRLRAVGYGESRPLASNETAAGMRANRRISAVIACANDIEGLTPAAARLTMALQMEFHTDSANIRPKYRDQIATVARYMKDHPEVSATIQGHASNRNKVTLDGSLDLSRLRAANVANYLVSEFGIARSRLTTEGFGETDRFAYNTTAEGQQDNQRVNVIFTYKR
jgi:OOP family OmpA-OmpF porin